MLETEEYTLSAEEIESEYKSRCSSYSYESIFRNSDDYIGEYAKFRGEVIQVLESDGEYTLRVNVTQGSYYWTDTMLIEYEAKPGEGRILEDDIVTFYGMLFGLYTYETIMGADVTIPLMFAEYIEY